MKKITTLLICSSIFLMLACNNEAPKDQAKTITEESTTEVASVTHTFNQVDATALATIRASIDKYLELKNALAADDDAKAAEIGNQLAETLKGLNKAALTEEQVKVIAENEEDLIENAEHIAKNKGNIKHQREHFVAMSEEMYQLVKSFGGNQTLYHAHCPMAQNNKGALWITESQEIKNPYFGAKMLSCGSIEEAIQ